jgi:hypothetical protein
MKFTKLSLIAILAVSSAFAGESTISGDVKVFYGTNDIGDSDMFDKGASYGDASASIDYTREIAKGISLNAGLTGISTLGLENTLVSDVWAKAGKSGINDTLWVDVANITAKMGKTTAVIGRQKLDTPLAFTETWNIVENTFDAFTFVNADVPKTKIIASAVTRANGMGNFTNVQGGMMDLGDGIYAAGLVTELIPMTTFQAWYYEGNGVVDTKKTWLQADAEVTKGLTLGAQYGADDEDAVFVAAKLGYDNDKLSTYVAFSQADDKGKVDFSNFGGFGGSKAYTEAWWNFGYVTKADATTISGGASYDLGSVKLGAQYTTVDSGALKNDMDELTVTADTSIGGVDASLAFINTTADDKNFDGNTVQVYMTVPFSL